MKRVQGSQEERVLTQLRYFGKEGLHSFWGYQNFIPRLSAVVYNLKKKGFEIASISDSYGCVYFLKRGNFTTREWAILNACRNMKEVSLLPFIQRA